MFHPLERRLLLAVTPINDDGNPQNLYTSGSTAYFSADDGVHGDELWKTDGTADGTVLVKDLVPGAVGGVPDSFIAFNGATYFLAQNKNNDQQLWRTDGTEAGTQIVADIRTVAGLRAGVVQMIVANGKLFMAVSGHEGYQGLFVSDGTTASTVKVRDFGPFDLVIMGAVNGTVLLNANGNDGNNNELWKTDGTSAGTVLVKDIFAGPDRSLPGGFDNDDNAVLGNPGQHDVLRRDGERGAAAVEERRDDRRHGIGEGRRADRADRRVQRRALLLGRRIRRAKALEERRHVVRHGAVQRRGHRFWRPHGRPRRQAVLPRRQRRPALAD